MEQEDFTDIVPIDVLYGGILVLEVISWELGVQGGKKRGEGSGYKI